MLRGDNGIITKATETKYSSGISQFDEQTKLASMAVRTSIEANKVSTPGYIATYNGTGADNKNYFTGLVNEVVKELGAKVIDAKTNSGETTKATIDTEGYTVAWYLDEGNTSKDGNGYIVIWYTDNGLRSTIDREKAITNYGLKELVENYEHKTGNEAVLVTVIHVENYKSELAVKGITSLTDSNSDIGQPKFGDTTLNGQTSDNENNSNEIFYKAWNYDGNSWSELNEEPNNISGINAIVYKTGKKIMSYYTSGRDLFYEEVDGLHLVITGEGAIPDYDMYGTGEICPPWQIGTIEGSDVNLYNTISELTIEEGINQIGDRLFMYCYALTDISLPNTLEKIGECSFYGCRQVISLTIPHSVVEVGNGAFSYWSNQQTINVPFKSGEKPNGWDDGWSEMSDLDEANIVYKK